MTLDRSRNKFGMTLAEAAPQLLNPSENLAKDVLAPSAYTPNKPYCHSELVSESVPQYEEVFNIGQPLKCPRKARDKERERAF